MNPFIFVAVIGFVSAFIQNGIGFGAALIMVNLLPLLFPISTSIAISQFTCMLCALLTLVKLRRNIRWEVLIPVMWPLLVVQTFFTVWSVGIDVSRLKVMMGFLFIGLSFYFFIFADRINLRPTRKVGMSVGCISGFLAGVFGAGGPPLVLYFVPALPDRNDYLATAHTLYFVMNVFSLSTRILCKAIHLSEFPYMATCCAFSLVGTSVGLACLKKLNGPLLRRFVYSFIGINGIVIILKQLV